MAEYDAAVRGNAVDVIWRLEHFAGPTPQVLNAALGLGWKDASRQALIMGASPHLDIPETLFQPGHSGRQNVNVGDLQRIA